jgi:NifU-like protein
MGAEALQAAVFDWAKKRGVHLNVLGIDIHAEEQEEGRLVCKCFALTEPYIKRKIKELNLRTIPEITSAIKAGGACMSCLHAPGGLQDILDDTAQERTRAESISISPTGSPPINLPVLHTLEPSPLPPPPPLPIAGKEPQTLSPFQFAKKIEKVIDNYIRPLLQRDGGDLELIDIKETMVYLELRGACASCAGAGQTLKHLVERTLREQVDEQIRVIQV